MLACTPAVQVATASDPQAKFGSYETFAMMQPNRPIHSENAEVDPFVMQRLRQLVYQGLKAKGYRPVPKGQADLVVAVLGARDEQLEVYSTGPYAYNTVYGPPSSYVYHSEQRVVVIDIVDQERKSVVWRGTGERALNGGLSDVEMRELVDAILIQFPSLSVAVE